MGSVQLKFDYVYKGMAYEGELSSEVRGTCKEGGVLFAYVQSRVVTSAKWPQGIIETSSKSRELAGPLASELLEIFRSNQTVIVGKLADYVLNGAKVDYHLKSASMERS
jgi:hypothetical protein